MQDTMSQILTGSSNNVRVNECAGPNCPCHKYQPAPSPGLECVLDKPMGLVVPAGGMHISCPVHGQHFIAPTATWC